MGSATPDISITMQSYDFLRITHIFHVIAYLRGGRNRQAAETPVRSILALRECDSGIVLVPSTLSEAKQLHDALEELVAARIYTAEMPRQITPSTDALD